MVKEGDVLVDVEDVVRQDEHARLQDAGLQGADGSEGDDG